MAWLQWSKVGQHFIMQGKNAVSLRDFCLLLIIFSAVFAGIGHARAECAYRYSQRTSVVQGHKVIVEIYQPEGLRTFPLVFMLHGSAGALRIQPGVEPTSDNFGEKMLASHCFTVVFPHYLEALGVESLLSQGEMRARSHELLHAVSQLLDDAEALPPVRDRPVFLFCQSLGGYLGVTLALERPEIAAVSEISGGLDVTSVPTRKKLPPLLISQGEDDRNVPAAEGKWLASFWRDHGGVVSEHYYKGQTHYISSDVLREMVGNTVQFFTYFHQE